MTYPFYSLRGFRRVLTILAGVTLVLATCPAWACTTCNRPLQEAILASGFSATLLKMLLPFLLIGLLVRFLYRLK